MVPYLITREKGRAREKRQKMDERREKRKVARVREKE